ncbi:HisA/HisF-related TIM barrel protein [Streptomyces zagrosensis]|uniref:Cyclase n=1 Tax=Streptomyces zagrosensis TaxID=1042984 RepID=A0A7W9QAI3_9ACTN|nr:HisA/HisF-related TIM barrel protein [Streptomyces zagrosensis]MBB5936414.1 cyclase [Streptomyces zagrosensis]
MTVPSTPVFHDRDSYVTDLIIPCMDVTEGHTTKPSRIAGLTDPWDAVAVAANYAHDGATKLFVDVVDPWERTDDYLYPLVRRFKDIGLSPLVSVGHGLIPSADHVGRLLEAGAGAVSVSTSMIDNPEDVHEAIDRYGAQRFVAVINSRPRESGGWEVYTDNGTKNSSIDVVDLARRLGDLHVGAILPNACEREGVGKGFDLQLTRTVAQASGLPVIASGGCGALDHLTEALSAGGATYILVNSMVHGGKFSIADIRDALTSSSSFA